MKNKLILILMSVLLVSCRGDDQESGAETFPVTPNPDSFAQFLNPAPAVPASGAVIGEIDNLEDFPEAYYNTIDPTDSRDTFEKWRIENGFLNPDGSAASCELPDCVSTHVKFRDTKDLGYGRNMFLHWDKITGDVAVYVENFQVDAIPGVPYGPLNYEALVNGDRSWNFGVNAIEFSAFPDSSPAARKFTKFYNFAGDGKRAFLASGQQQHFVDLDGRGVKPMPTPCIVCHGGHGRTLVVENNAGVKVLAPTLPGGIAGDVQANMQSIELNTLQFANAPGFTQADSEDGIRIINDAILSTYQHRKDTVVQTGEWVADFAMEIVNGRYNGDPSNSANRYNETFIPTGWQANPNAESIYNGLVGPNCMVCHALRGSGLNPTLSFSDFAGFLEYAEQIDHLTYERGLMPLGLLNYADFWESGEKNPALLAAAIGHPERINADNSAIKPGAPVAQIVAPLVAAGINTTTGQSYDIPLSAGGSAFAAAGSYQWSVEPSGQATITLTGEANGAALLRTTVAGDYTVALSVSGANGGSSSASQVVSVQDETAQLPAPENLEFYATGSAGIATLLENSCASCHSDNGLYPGIPIHYLACDGASLAGGAQQGFEFLYRSVLARVNFNAPLDSLIVRKPINGATDITQRGASRIQGYHGGALALDNDADLGRLVAWILRGAPRGTLPPASAIPVGAPSCL